MTKGSASKKSWTMWQLSTRRVVYYAIAPARDTEEGTTFLDGFKGIAVGDAYIVHKSMAKTSNHRLAFCWVHARRTFIKAEANDPIRARQFIEMVQELYAVEAQAPPGPDGDEERRRLRNEKSQPITKTMKTWLLEQRFLPASDFGKAVRYVTNNWEGLCIFLDEPQVPLDNNQVERGFRSPAIGRNNFYGSHSRRGTEVAAIFYSLLESAKLNNVDPKTYLKTAMIAALAGKRIPLPHELV
jgi:transposase